MRLNAAKVEAIEVADANLNNADLPLYSALLNAQRQERLTVKVEVRSVYGTEKIYPANFEAERFAAIAGTKTLSLADLENIKRLGILVEEVSPKKLKLAA